jgi:hypothetical protein
VVAKEAAAKGKAGERIARLTFRVHLPESSSGWDQVPALTRCYRVDFSTYGVMDGSPRSTDCPVRTSWVEAAPAPPRRVTPVGSIEAVRRVLARAPRAMTVEALRASIERALPAQPAHTLRPTIGVGADGPDLGVALRDDGGCLLAARLDGVVTAWALSPAQAQPGEISCAPASALGRLGTRPPH